MIEEKDYIENRKWYNTLRFARGLLQATATDDERIEMLSEIESQLKQLETPRDIKNGKPRREVYNIESH